MVLCGLACDGQVMPEIRRTIPAYIHIPWFIASFLLWFFMTDHRQSMLTWTPELQDLYAMPHIAWGVAYWMRRLEIPTGFLALLFCVAVLVTVSWATLTLVR